MREVIVTGKTVEEAIENGCRELGLSRSDVSVETLELPTRRFFKTLPAKVKVTAIEEEPVAVKPAAQPKAPAKAPEKKAEKKPEKPVENAAPKKEQKPKKQAVLPAEPEEPIDLVENLPAARAAAYLSSVFDAMGAVDYQITAAKQGDATLLRVEGEGVARVIETKGEVVQALSYLTDRAVNKGVDKKDGDYLRVRLDIAGYRGRRESELTGLATRAGKEVQKTHRSKTLAPMNPYERLIVHTTISGMEGLVSESVGSDTERRVVIRSTAADATEGDDWKAPRKGPRNDRGRGGNGNRGGQNRGGRGGNDRRREGGDRRRDNGPRPQRTSTPEREYADKPRDPNAAPVVPERREQIRDGEDLPLYGKIEL